MDRTQFDPASAYLFARKVTPDFGKLAVAYFRAKTPAADRKMKSEVIRLLARFFLSNILLDLPHSFTRAFEHTKTEHLFVKHGFAVFLDFDFMKPFLCAMVIYPHPFSVLTLQMEGHYKKDSSIRLFCMHVRILCEFAFAQASPDKYLIHFILS